MAAVTVSVLSACGSLPASPARLPSQALAAPQTTPLGQMVQAQRRAAQTPYASGFSLLGGAEAAFTSRLALVQAATRTLDLQYYAIHADASTARLLEAVVQAAQRGVRVRILLDDFHGAGKNAQVMRLAFVPGIEMRMFNPLTGPRGSTVLRALSTLADFQRTQQRMHNKLFIADNSIGITGGRNLGDAYFDALDSDNFIDLDILAAGEVVQQLSLSFDRYWNDARAYPVSSLVSEAQLLAMRARAADTDSEAERVRAAIASSKTAALGPMDLAAVPWIWAPALVLADAPGKIAPPPEDITATSPADTDDASFHKADADADAHTGTTDDSDQLLPGQLPRTLQSGSPTRSTNREALMQVLEPVIAQDNVVNGLLALIDQARTDILIVSPYFVPGEDMKQAFARARARGIRVRILTNSLASNDAPLAHAGYARHRKDLLAQGIALYELRSIQNGQADTGTLRSTAGSITGSQGGSRAMLHSKMVVLDHKLTVVGSMNLDMRSQLHNTEIALLIASRRLAQEATDNIEASLREAAWLLEDTPQGLLWRAPEGSDWGNLTTEPDASLPLRWMIRLIGPLAPEHLL
ncbi:MAG: phospholipase D family protein [Comamonas sp.]